MSTTEAAMSSTVSETMSTDALAQLKQEIKQEVKEEVREEFQTELEAERTKRKELEDALNDTKSWVFDLEDVVYGDLDSPLAVGRAEEDGGILLRVEDLEEGTVDESPSKAVIQDRSEFRPIYKMWLDVRDGDVARLGDTERRAARIFGDFIKRADPTNGTYSYSSGQAKRCLEEADDITAGGKSKTVTRAMEAIQRYSKKEDDAPLVTFDGSRGTNYLVARKDRWDDEMARYETILSGGINNTDDDSIEVDESEVVEEDTARRKEIEEEVRKEEAILFANPDADSDNVVSPSEGDSSEPTKPTQR